MNVNQAMALVSVLTEALQSVLPYALSRGEDLVEAKALGNEDPNYEGADIATERIERAQHTLDMAIDAVRDYYTPPRRAGMKQPVHERFFFDTVIGVDTDGFLIMRPMEGGDDYNCGETLEAFGEIN